ncbi:hypothetical protein V5O48_002979 [Marasmius crinis-equi]|uniref:Uncharacterized protein n=1 Tax=Marasmius crinis-equi TaxID=585013 RepID=A0ABR3FU64_9AGAR
MTPLPNTKILFATAITQATLYGVSLVLFGLAVRELLLASIRNKTFLAVSLTFLVSSTISFAAFMHMALNMISDNERAAADFPPLVSWMKHATTPAGLITQICFSFSTLLADAFMVHRCYRVWNSKLAVILPCALWISLLVVLVETEIWILRVFSGDALAKQSVKRGKNEVHEWFFTTVCLSFATNFVCLILLTYKIIRIDRGAVPYRIGSPSTSGRVLRIILESGAIYSFFLLASLITVVTDSKIQKFFIDNHTAVIPSTFYLVIIRLGRARRASDANTEIGAETTFKSACFKTPSLGSSSMTRTDVYDAEKLSPIPCPPSARDPNLTEPEIMIIDHSSLPMS